MGERCSVGDLDRPETVRAAVRGVDSIFLMQTSHGTEQTETVVAAAEDAGVRRIVMLSSMGAALDPMPVMGTWFAARERVLTASGLDVAFLRPSTLMPNSLAWAPSIREHGSVTDPTGLGRLSSVDTDDVAEVAAAVLTEDGHTGQAYTLTGSELLTTRQQVEILAGVLGRDIKFIEETPRQAAETAEANGTPAEAAEAMRNLNEFFRADKIAFLTDTVARITGHAPGTFRNWCERNKARFA